MRKWVLCTILTAVALPTFATTRVTVQQLEAKLLNEKSKSDAEIARQLDTLQLTERLSSARLAQLRGSLPGEKSQRALVALVDSAAFLDPPPADIPATATPTQAAQRRMLARTVDYLGKTLPLLPNLFAARDTTGFENRAEVGTTSTDNPLHETTQSHVGVLYRNGREFVDAGETKDNKPQAPDRGLTTWGEFGPILGTVVLDAAHSQLAWSHWELGPAGPQAVFSYVVPKEKSHYDVRFCCYADNYGLNINVLTQRAGYHGQITVDPDSGTILRVTVLADLDESNPIGPADVAVEYGPALIGDKTYFVPVRGIALAQGPDLKSVHKLLDPTALGGATLQKASLTSLSESPRQTLLNDVAFRDFHIFRAEATIVTGDSAAPGTLANLPSSPAPLPAPSADTAVDSSTLAAAAPPSGSVSGSVEPSLVAVSKIPEPIIPEISVVPINQLPRTPAISPSTADTNVTLRLNARLVDLSLVALDKKGHPITNIKPEDLQVFDDGVKVDIRSFAQTGGVNAPPSASSGTDQPVPAQQSVYSNRIVNPAKAANGEAQANTIVLLIDSNLSWDDLVNVREQMEHFLNGLQPNESAAVLIMKEGSFQILQAPTTDHALLATTLAKWRPSAQSISHGEEMEARNRQSMEHVMNPESLLNVNGNTQNDATTNTQPLDVNLRQLGSRPEGGALAGLFQVAQHLASIPGHKSLVWIASDSVLADWTNNSLSIDKGDKHIDAVALRTQEAMNSAHVSVYPLDASRLEAGGVNAAIGTRNVELSPTYPTGLPGQAQPSGPEMTSGQDVNALGQGRDLRPGRISAQMQQDMRPIQGMYRELADATGGRVFRRASDIVRELSSVADDGRATYLLTFTPARPADGKYHIISIKIANRKDVRLQYRSGYLFRQEPTTIEDRFHQVALEPEEASEIGIQASPVSDSKGRTVKLSIAATDLEIAQGDAAWTDKLDIFLIKRDVDGNKAKITGQSLDLRLKPATYQQYLRDGVPFNQEIELAPGTASVRILVIDENSGRMGSVTLPASAVGAKS